MKRWIGLVLCVMLLTACTASPTQPVTTGFTAEVTLLYDQTTYTGILERPAEQALTLTLTSPSTVDGLKLVWEQNTLSATFAGMTLSLDQDALPIGSVMELFCETLDQCGADTLPSKYASTISGKGSCGAYTMTFDDETGYPLRLEIPSLPLEATFVI